MAKRVKLDARLDSAAADRLRAQLSGSADGDLTLDATSVEMLGGLCLELILSARSLWSARAKAFAVDAPSAAMIDDLARYGLTPEALAGDAA